MDCCCSAGSIAISGEAPLSSDVETWDKFSVAYGTWPAARSSGRSSLPASSPSCLTTTGESSGLKAPVYPWRMIPTIGHFGNSRRSSLTTQVTSQDKIPGDDTGPSPLMSKLRCSQGYRLHRGLLRWVLHISHSFGDTVLKLMFSSVECHRQHTPNALSPAITRSSRTGS